MLCSLSILLLSISSNTGADVTFNGQPVGSSEAPPQVAAELASTSKELLVVLPVVVEREEDTKAAEAATAAIVKTYAENQRFDVQSGQTFLDAAGVGDAYGECAKTRCAKEVAKATKARFVVTSRLFHAKDASDGAVLDLKVYSSRRGKPVQTSNAASPVAAADSLLAVVPDVVRNAIPPVEAETPKTDAAGGDDAANGDASEEKVPTIFDDPIFTIGAAMTVAGSALIAAGLAQYVAAELAVRSPSVHRAVKGAALQQWWWGLVAAGGGAAVGTAGLATMGAGALFFFSNKE